MSGERAVAHKKIPALNRDFLDRCSGTGKSDSGPGKSSFASEQSAACVKLPEITWRRFLNALEDVAEVADVFETVQVRDVADGQTGLGKQVFFALLDPDQIDEFEDARVHNFAEQGAKMLRCHAKQFRKIL